MPDENDPPKKAARSPRISLNRGDSSRRFYIPYDEESLRATFNLTIQFWHGDYALQHSIIQPINTLPSRGGNITIQSVTPTSNPSEGFYYHKSASEAGLGATLAQ